MRKYPTEAEKLLWNELRKQTKYKFSTQVVILGWIADFYCASTKVVIEVDGDSHARRKTLDGTRDAVLRNQRGIITLRFTNEEVLTPGGVAKVVDQILRFCDGRPKRERKK